MTESSRNKRRSRNLTQADYEALARLRYLLRRFAAFSASAAQAQGLPAQQHQALLAIKGYAEDEPMTVGALAERLLITPHSATELVDRLQASGMVLRRRDARDRRRLVLSLTTKAEAMLRSLSVVHLREIRATTPALLSVLARLTD
jgi:DNA-binding MarR family transcriptional regulator